MSDLLNSLKNLATPALLDQVAGKLGENPSNVQKALTGLVPTVLSGLVSKSGDNNAMNGIFDLLKGAGGNNVLDGLSGLVSSGSLAHDNPANPASGLLSSLFGNKLDGIVNLVSGFSGVKNASASSLLGLAGSLVTGFLGNKIASGLSLSSLTGLLNTEKSGILSAVPGGLGPLLNLSLPNVSAPKVNTGSSKWIWILLAALLAALLFWWKGCNKPEVPAVDVPNVDTVAKKVENAVDNTTAAVTGWFRKLSSGFELRGDSTGIERGLVEFIESGAPVDKTTWFNFDRLTFKTGSAELDMDKSTDQLNNIAEILKAFPLAGLKIGGYTDNTGDEAANMTLSKARAETVMNALTGLGIEKGRLEAEGYGSQHPVADNATEEGRAKNRRIAVRVTKK